MKRSPNAGRKLGQQNRINRDIKEAMLTALSLYGQDGKGKNELIGFFFRYAGRRPDLIFGILAKILPTQLKGEINVNATVTAATRFTPAQLAAMPLEQKIAAYRELVGMTQALPPPAPIPQLNTGGIGAGGVTIDGEATEVEADDVGSENESRAA